MFKNIFEDILTVSFAQAPGWQKLDESFDKRQKNFLSDFMYPIMGITTIVKFLVVLISRGGLELAIKNACATFITLFVSFFLIIFILNELSKKFLLHDNNKRILLFTGYILSMICLIDMALFVFPELFFLYYAYIYVGYVAWLGTASYLKLPKQQQVP